MPVQEQTSDKIFKLNEDLSKFIYEDKEINAELNEYSKNFKNGLSRDSLAYFMFEKKIEGDKKLIDIYLKKEKNLPAEDKKALKEFKNSIDGVFEIRKVLKDGFEMYNLVNEKTYTVKSLIKMVSYRGVSEGNYFSCRLIPYEKEYYLLVLHSVMRSTDREIALKLAISRQIEAPELIYKDNSKKLKSLEKMVADLNKKFSDFAGKSEILTDNCNIDTVLEAFNDFAEVGKKSDKEFSQKFSPEELKYFAIKSASDPFSMTFSSKNTSDEKYDVGILFDPELGIQVLPFYATFCEIFRAKDHTKVSGYKECINDYLKNEKVSPYVIKCVCESCEEKFLKITNEALEHQEPLTLDELLDKYKKDFSENKKFSSTTVLYASEAFNELMELSALKQIKEEVMQTSKQIGRNDSCPCGSGKKFKKCCAK